MKEIDALIYDVIWRTRAGVTYSSSAGLVVTPAVNADMKTED
jgi:hypothetical protein